MTVLARIPQVLLKAALCIVAVELGYSLSKNMMWRNLVRVLRNKLPGYGDLADEILEELVRKGYIARHGGRDTLMLTRYGRAQALRLCKET